MTLPKLTRPRFSVGHPDPNSPALQSAELIPITDEAAGGVIGYGLNPERAQLIVDALQLTQRVGYLLNIEMAYNDYGPDQSSPSRLEHLIFRTPEEREQARAATEALTADVEDFNVYDGSNLVLMNQDEVFDTLGDLQPLLRKMDGDLFEDGEDSSDEE